MMTLGGETIAEKNGTGRDSLTGDFVQMEVEKKRKKESEIEKYEDAKDGALTMGWSKWMLMLMLMLT
jgi:hypothetical protein